MDGTTPIIIPVSLDEKTFKRFARFDQLRLRGRWKKPAVFSLILVLFAAVALMLKKEQSGLIAAVLLAVGLGLPLVWFGTFASQLNMQVLQQKLKPPRAVYTVTLAEEGLWVENSAKKEETLELAWDKLCRAVQDRGCVYLYATPAKAFLLPEGQANVPDGEVWAFLEKHLGSERCLQA